MQNKFKKLVDIMSKLRSPGSGCPWDIKQTHETLQSCMVEETYELLDAINDNNIPRIKEELADILFLVIFHSRIAEESGHFDIEDIVTEGIEKMISRHPHVFGDKNIKTSEEALHQWENIKSEESKHQDRKSAVDGIPRKLPALQKAVKIQKKAAKAGFDWENIDGVVEKIEEELRELKIEIKADNKNNITEELGDFLFSVVNLSRFIDTEPEYALHKTIKKFENRFRKMEKIIKESGKKMQDMPLKELDNYWEMLKK